MLSLSYLMVFGPKLFTNIVAWVGIALAYLAALGTRRTAKNGRSHLVIASAASAGGGDMLVTIANVGSRFARDIELVAPDGTRYGYHGGVAGDSEVQIPSSIPLSSPITLRIEWFDASGEADHVSARLELTDRSWRSVRIERQGSGGSAAVV